MRSNNLYATTEEFMKVLAEGGFVPVKYKNYNTHGITEVWINPDCDIIRLLPTRKKSTKEADVIYTRYKYNPNTSTNNAGYHLVHLQAGHAPVLLHRVMAYTFLGNPTDEQRDINHIDGDKNNNAVSNLEYCTHQYNMQKHFEMKNKKEE